MSDRTPRDADLDAVVNVRALVDEHIRAIFHDHRSFAQAARRRRIGFGRCVVTTRRQQVEEYERDGEFGTLTKEKAASVKS